MESLRAGFGSRLGALILDAFFVILISLFAVTIGAIVGGVKLGIEIQQSFGVPVSFGNVTSGEAWQRVEARAQEVGRSIESSWRRDFNQEQIDFIASKIGDQFATHFTPRGGDIGELMKTDPGTIRALISSGFDAVKASGRSDIDARKLDAAQAQLAAALEEFHVDSVVPAAMSFLLSLLAIPFAVAIVYMLVEAFSGITLGKLIVRVRIGALDGSHAAAGMLFSRFLIKTMWLILVFVGIIVRNPTVVAIGGLAAVVTFIGAFVSIGSQRRALHDYAAGTAVYFR